MTNMIPIGSLFTCLDRKKTLGLYVYNVCLQLNLLLLIIVTKSFRWKDCVYHIPTTRSKICKGALFSLHQDIPHCLDTQSFFFVVIQISTCICFIVVPSAPKPQPGVTFMAICLIVAENTDSCFGTTTQGTLCVKPFLFTVPLQWGFRTNQRQPLVSTQWGAAILPISDQRVQGVRLLVNDSKIDLVVDLHTEADLGEGCVPVGGKFGLLWVKPSLPSVKVEGFVVAPESGIVVKRLLWEKGGRNRKIVL